ncbi:hypothetical protein ACFQAQ_20475 [Novosphingobium resinovorum]
MRPGLAFEQVHVASTARDQAGGGAAGQPTAEDQCIGHLSPRS